MDAYFPPSKSSDETRAAVRGIADMSSMLIWVLDANNVCTYLNPTCAARFSPGERIDLSVWLEFIHPEDCITLLPNLRAAIDAREEYQFRYRIVRSDGSVRWMMGSGAPRFGEDGGFLGYVGNEIDVSEQQHALEKIIASETTHRLLTENSSDVIAHHAMDGTIAHVSPSVERMLGFTPEELKGQNVLATVHPDDAVLLSREIARQSAGGDDSRVVEVRKRHKLGHYVWFSSKLSVLRQPDSGQPIGVISVCRDVTSERQAREALKEREERFRSLTDLSSDWYWETDEDGRFTFLSDGVSKVFETPASAYHGRSRREMARDPAEPGLAEYARRCADRQPFRDIRYSTTSLPGVGGRVVSISGEPLYRAGAFAGYRGVGRDVTQEMELAARLARLADENEALVDNSLDIIALVDDEGRFQRVNRALEDILGYRTEEWVGRRYIDFLHEDDREMMLAADGGLRTGHNTVVDLESRWRRKDGGVRHLALSVRWAADKKLMYATARDVTERYRAQEELQRSKDQLSTILESMGEAFFALDGQWRITYANRKSLEFVGLEAGQALGKILMDVVPGVMRSELYRHYQTVMSSRVPLSVDAYWAANDTWVEVRIFPQADGIGVYFHNINERRAAERAIRASEQKFREIIEMTPAGYILASGDAQFLDVNPALCALTGYDKEELVGYGLDKIFSHCPWHGALAVPHGPTSARGMEAVVRHKSGRDMHVLFSGSIRRDGDGAAQSFTAFLTDITERKQVESQLEALATHDMLTGLPNRVYVHRRLKEMLDAARADDRIAIMFIDLDRFKEVNDSMGHAPGDILLREVASRLQANMRPGDLVARLGGDEFLVAAHCSAGRRSASAIAEKLLVALAQPFPIEGQEVYVGASIGISMFPEDGRTREMLFQHADTAMYRAKDGGRCTYRFFEAEMSAATKRRVTIEQSLRHALERGEFTLHYQPKVDLKTLAFAGVEALLRWDHPQLGRIPPAEFIPIAEDRGLIAPIGTWVLREATRQSKYLADRYGRAFPVSVNLSAHQLKCADLVEQVVDALQASAWPAHLLELELTESALIDNVEQSVTMLKRLKALGLRLSVDDFGTGYSALSYLKRFPVDILKLDRSFVEQQPEGISSFEFIKAFVDMAHALRLSVVAEGIETVDMLRLLSDAHCDEGQGYVFARPMPVGELEDYLRREVPGSEFIRPRET